MAYDFVVGKSNLIKDDPILLGGIEFDMYPTIASLQKRFELSIFTQLCNLFEDYTFNRDELIQAKEDLYQVMVCGKLKKHELAFIYKLVAIVCYAADSDYSLHGVAD